MTMATTVMLMPAAAAPAPSELPPPELTLT